MSDESENRTPHVLREVRETCNRTEAKVGSLSERMAALEMKTDRQSGQLSMVIGLLTNHTDRLELLEGRDR